MVTTAPWICTMTPTSPGLTLPHWYRGTATPARTRANSPTRSGPGGGFSFGTQGSGLPTGGAKLRPPPPAAPPPRAQPLPPPHSRQAGAMPSQ